MYFLSHDITVLCDMTIMTMIKNMYKKKVDRVSIPFQYTYLSFSLSLTFFHSIHSLSLSVFKMCILLLLYTLHTDIIGGGCKYVYLFFSFLTFWLLIVLIFCTNWVHEQVCMFYINTFYRVSCGTKCWTGWVCIFQLYL